MNLPSSTRAQEQLKNGDPAYTDPSSTPKATHPRNQTDPVVNTFVAMTVTPVSATGSLAGSARNSPAPSSTIKAQPVLPSDRHYDYNASPHHYPLPNPTTAPSSVSSRAVSHRTMSDRSPSPHYRNTTTSMSEAVAASRSPGLIRRLSRGAHQKLRRKTSYQHTLRMRDQSAGPVLLRRRSDSNGASDLNQDMSDLELDTSVDGIGDDPSYAPSIRDRPNGLGIHSGRPSNASSNFEGGIAPSVSAILQDGTWVTKYAQKGKKRLKISLDPNSARVRWHSTNLAKSFFIDDVTELRIGADCRNALDGAQIPEEHEERAMTIVYNPPDQSKTRSRKVMHLVMDSDTVLSYWKEALNTVTRERTEIMNALTLSTERSERSMAMIWKLAMNRKPSDAAQLFSIDDARWFCRKLEINCSDSAVRTHFTRSDTSRTGLLDYEQYRDFVNSFKERKDLHHIFQYINFGTDLDLDLEGFLDFLRTDQHVDVDKERAHWESVFDRFAKSTQNRPALPDAPTTPHQRTLNRQNFQNFLTSSYNSPLAARKAEVTLDRPLNEYFISSSHNTYLVGRQFAGLSSVEGYIVALIKGCRCVEVDCWDGDGGRPMVTHGRTMSSKVSFEDCVSTIAKYAFHSSPYPLVVSLEVHCNVQQQKTMVDLMTSYWKDQLVTEPITPDAATLPSPEELKHRIIVKVKAAQDNDPGQLLADVANGRSRARSLSSAFTRTPSVDRHHFAVPPTMPGTTSPSEPSLGSISTPRGSTTSGPTMSPSSSADDSDDVAVPLEKSRRQKTSNIIPELGRLGVYAQGIKFHSFLFPESKAVNHIFSFAENKFGKLCSKNAESKGLLETHNLRHLMRVYPAARRVDSSNFDPLSVWRRGVQMAALNWQTYDVYQQVNEAMFAAGSDRLGYVLKPDELRPAKHTPIADTLADASAAERRDKKGKKFVKFTVRIISAHRLPRPRHHNPVSGMNPYIEFEMFSADDKARGIARGDGGSDVPNRGGNARDGSSVNHQGHGLGSPVRKRTKIVEGNGFDPIWNENLQLSVQTKYPSLLFVRWTVWNAPDARTTGSNNGLLATFTAKLDSLQQGYRHLPLFNPHGEQYRDAKLWVRITKDAPIPLLDDGDGGAMSSSNSAPTTAPPPPLPNPSIPPPAGPTSIPPNTNGHTIPPLPPSQSASSTPDPHQPSSNGVSSSSGAGTPRPDALQRSERSWSRRGLGIFTRNPSERRKQREGSASGEAASRPSSVERGEGTAR